LISSAEGAYLLANINQMSIDTSNKDGIRALIALRRSLRILADCVSEICSRIFVPSLITCMIESERCGRKMRNDIVVMGHSLICSRSEVGQDVVCEGLVASTRRSKSVH